METTSSGKLFHTLITRTAKRCFPQLTNLISRESRWYGIGRLQESRGVERQDHSVAWPGRSRPWTPWSWCADN